MHYLGLCCIVNDGHPFLEEWIAFHTLMKAESYIIYDNDSNVPVCETLRSMQADGYITILHAPGRAKQILRPLKALDCFPSSQLQEELSAHSRILLHTGPMNESTS